MFRRITALGFLFLAHAILLVHALIPHHHHNDSICLEPANHQNACALHENGQHHPHSEAVVCLLQNTLFLPSQHEKMVVREYPAPIHNPLFHGYALVPRPEAGIEAPSPLPIINSPFSAALSGRSFLSSQGLRAPPQV